MNQDWDVTVQLKRMVGEFMGNRVADVLTWFGIKDCIQLLVDVCVFYPAGVCGGACVGLCVCGGGGVCECMC